MADFFIHEPNVDFVWIHMNMMEALLIVWPQSNQEKLKFIRQIKYYHKKIIFQQKLK